MNSEFYLILFLKYIKNRRQMLMAQHFRRHCELLEERKIAYHRRKLQKHFLSTQFSFPERLFSLVVPRFRRFMARPRDQNHWNSLQEPINKEIFYESFRMSFDAFHLLCTKLEPFLQISYNSTTPPVAIEKQVAICVYKLSTCAEYRVVGDVFGVHKSTVHKYFHRVIDAIVALKDEYIQFPKLEESLTIAEEFEKLSHIPNIIGAIDGTHIPMLPPSAGHLDYVNRKGWTSIIMQAVVDNKYMFRDVCVKCPGSTHDAAVFKQSGLYKNSSKLIPSFFFTIQHEYIQPQNGTSLQIIEEQNCNPKELRNKLKNYLQNNFPLKRSQF